MRARRLAVAALVLLPLWAACPLDDLDPDKGGMGGFVVPPNPFGDAGLSGQGGMGGLGAGGAVDAGKPGTGGTSGAGGSPAAGGPCRVKCLEDLISRCTPAAGTCVGESNLDTGMTNICFSNGVKYYSVASNTGSVDRLVNPDGTTCYIQETPIPTGDSGKITAYWKDGTGKLVATQMVDVNKKTSSYVCADGTSYQLGPECWGKAAGGPDMTSGGCAQGTCR